MTRDPSDGSVREKPAMGIHRTETPLTTTGGIPGNLATGDPKPPVPTESVAGIPTSGLREPGGKADQLARLQRSRDWLSKYRTNPEAVARLKGDTDHPTGEERGE